MAMPDCFNGSWVDALKAACESLWDAGECDASCLVPDGKEGDAKIGWCAAAWRAVRESEGR